MKTQTKKPSAGKKTVKKTTTPKTKKATKETTMQPDNTQKLSFEDWKKQLDALTTSRFNASLDAVEPPAEVMKRMYGNGLSPEDVLAQEELRGMFGLGPAPTASEDQIEQDMKLADEKAGAQQEAQPVL